MVNQRCTCSAATDPHGMHAPWCDREATNTLKTEAAINVYPSVAELARERDVLEANYKAAMGTVNDYAKGCHELRARVMNLEEFVVQVLKREHSADSLRCVARVLDNTSLPQSLAEHDAALLERVAGVWDKADPDTKWWCDEIAGALRVDAAKIRKEAGLCEPKS